jgi:hypothetical protein
MIFMESGSSTSKSPSPPATITRSRQDRNGASPTPNTIIRAKAKLPYKNRISRDASREDEDRRRKLHCLKLFRDRHERRGALCDTGEEKTVKRVKNAGPDSKDTGDQAPEPEPGENQETLWGMSSAFQGGNHGLQVGTNYGSIHLIPNPEDKKAPRPPSAPSKYAKFKRNNFQVD